MADGGKRRDREPANDNGLAEYQRAIEPLIARVMDGGSLLKSIANADHARWCDAQDRGYKPSGEFRPGDRVVMTARALYSMHGADKLVAAEAVKEWTVVECSCQLCASGRLVATHELIALDDDGEVVTHRHISKTALRHRGQPYSEELPPHVTDSDMAAIQRGLRDAFRGNH